MRSITFPGPGPRGPGRGPLLLTIGVFGAYGVFRFLHSRCNNKEPELKWWKYKYTPRKYYLLLNPNNNMIHDIHNYNIDCLRHRGYRVTVNPSVSVYDENDNIEIFLNDCKECNVYSELRYSQLERNAINMDHNVKLEWYSRPLQPN